MTGSRRISTLTRRDLPALCLLMAAWAFLAAVGFQVIAQDAEPPPYGELVATSGQLTNAFVMKRSGKGHSEVHILIQAADGLHDCAQETSKLTLSLLNVAKGTEVAALFLAGSIDEPVHGLWALRSGHTVLLSYESLADQAAQKTRHATLAGRAFAAFAILSLLGALILRREFGAWRAKGPNKLDR